MGFNNKIVFAFFFSVIHVYAAINSFKVSSSPSTILQTATLTAELLTDDAMTNGDYFEITLPGEVSVSQGVLTCSEIFAGITITCQASSQVIRITLGSSFNAFTTLRFQIQGFNNPSSTKPTSKFSVISYNSGGNQLDTSQIGSDPTLSATADTITTTSFVSNSNIVGETTSAVLSFTTKNAIPAGGLLTLTFPEKWNPNAPSASQESYYSSSVTCTGTSNVDAGASCAVSGDTLTLSSAFLTEIAPSTSVAFSISQIRNPRSAKTVTGITLSTQDASGFNIDSTSDVTLTGVSNARSFSSINLSILDQVVGQTSSMQMTMGLDIPVDIGAYVVLVYPNDLVLADQPISDVLATGSYDDPDLNQISDNGQTQTISNLVLSYESSFSGILIIRSITNPSSTKPIDSFHYSLYDSSDNIIAQATTGLTYTPTAGTLSGLAIAASNTEVFATTTWRFTLTLTTQLSQDSQIRITLPNEVAPVAGSCSPLAELTGVTNTAANCQIAGQIVTVQNPFSSSNGGPANAQLIFKLATGTIVNPVTTAAITTVTVETRTPASDGQYLVDSGTISNPFTLTAGQMGTVTVIPDPATAYTSATYTFSITSGHPYPDLSKLTITLPSEVSMPNTAVSTTTCTHSSANLGSMQCSAASANSIEILMKLGSQQGAGTVYSFTIGGVLNQRTTAATSSYQLQVTTEDGTAQIEGRTSGIVSLVTDVPDYTSFSVTPTSFVNSATTTYTFAATTNNVLIDGDKIKITPQTQVTNPTSPTCAGVSANMESSLTCTLNGNEVIVTLDFTTAVSNQLASGGSFSFSVAGYQNPSNTDAPSSNFSILTVTTDEVANVEKYTGTLQVQTTTAATMVQHTTISDFLQTSSLVPSLTTTTYTFAARTVSNIPQNSVFRVYVPSQVTVGGSSACSGDGTGLPSSLTCSYNSALAYFQITNAFPTLASYPPRDFTVSITNLENPSTATPSSSFKLETRTASGGLIDGLNSGMTVTVQCNAPCATCNANAPDQCLSCISNLAPSGDPYLLQGNTCVTSCSAGYLLNSGGTQCDACTDNCFTCENNLNFCTACTGQYSLKNNECITDCGEGFFSSSNVCSTCDSSVFCATCTTAATVCTSCISGKFLQGSNCQDSCNSPGFVADSNNICQACTGNCVDCQNTVDNCIQCATNYFNHGGSCVTSCPSGTTIQDTANDECDDCASTCATCISTVNTCTSCVNGLVKNGSTCIASCPSGTSVQVNGECQSCSLTCATCESTTTNCLSCNSGLYLVTNSDGSKTCATSCPSDQYISGSSCVSCPSGQTLNASGTGCDGTTTGTSGSPVEFVIFPFLIAAFAMLLIALASKLYKGDSYFFSITVLLWAFIETAVILFQTLQALIFGSTTVFIITFVALLFLIVCNILIAIIYCRKISKDSGFARAKKKNLHCYRFIHVLSVGWNFRIIRLHYSRFFGADVFKQSFKNFQNNFAKPLSFVTIAAMILVSLPIIILDMAAVAFWLPWGYQLTITCIESLIIEALMLVWIALEFKAFRDPEFGDKDDYEELKEIDDMNEEDRRVVFSKIIDELKNRGAVTSGFLPEDQGYQQDDQDCMSDIPQNHAAPYLNDRAEKRKTLSYPPSPRTLDQKLRDLHLSGGLDRTSPEPMMLPDNVYAESQPAQPLKKKGKTYIDSVTQTHRKKKRKVVNEQGELETIIETESESEYDQDELAMLERERKGKKLNRNEDLKKGVSPRGDKNKDLLEIDSPKGEKSRLVDPKHGAADKMRGSGGKSGLKDAAMVAGGAAAGAGVGAAAAARSPKETEKQKKEREKREQEKLEKVIDKKTGPLDERLGAQEKKMNAMILTAQEKAKKEKEDKKKKDKDAQRKKRMEDEGRGAMDELEQEPFVDSPVGEKESPRQVLGPRDHQEMDAIMKEHERKLRGEESKTALIDHASGEELPGWEMTDKYSLKNNTVPGGATTIGEPEHDLATLYPELENLELAPNYIDYDDIRGDFIRDQMGNVVITKNDKGELVDKQGRRVNKLGYMVDENDNVINSRGEKVDIIGDFEKDKQGNFKIIKDTAQPTTNGQENFIDVQGRPVNDKGYLVDREAGHIMSSRGSIVAKKGDLDFDQDGDPILLTDKHGYPVDKEGRRVNQRGYLVDNSGNLLNDENKVAVVNEELSSDEDLPVVIPTEKPPVRRKTKNAVNQEDEELMKNIEAQAAQHHRGPRVEDDLLSDEVEQHLDDLRPSSGSTSVQSLMEDTPTNYNLPNMRFDQDARMDRKASKKPHFHPEYVDEEEQSDEFDLEDDNFQKIIQPRKIKPKRYKQPGTKDKRMAAAYGGEARGAPIRRKLKTQNSKAQLRKPRNKLEGLTNSVSGFGYEGPIQSGLPPRGESSLMTGADPRHMMSSLEMDQLRDEEQYRKETLQALNRHKKKGKKGKKGKKRPSSRNSDLEKIYGNVDDFDSSGSEYTLFSSASKQTSRSKLQGVKKIRGLETIYLQRLDPARSVSNMRKNKKSYSAAPGGRIMSNAAGVGVGRAKHPKFRQMQDRFQDDPAFLATESEKDEFSLMSDYKQLTKLHPGSARAGFATGHPVLQGGGQSGNVLLHPSRYNDQGSSPRGQWM